MEPRILPPGDRRPDEHFGLPRLAREEHGEGGGERLVERRARLARQRDEPRRSGRIELGADQMGAERASAVGRRIAGDREPVRCAVERRSPPRQALAQLLALKKRPLPQRKIAVLEGERGKRVAGAFAGGAVERGELAVDDAGRPAIGDDVVAGADEDVFLGRKLQEPHAKQRSLGERERSVPLRLYGLADRSLARLGR